MTPSESHFVSLRIVCLCVCVCVVCIYALLATEAKKGHWIPYNENFGGGGPLPLMWVLEAKFESPEMAASILKCQALFSTLLSLYSQTASPSVSNNLF